MKELNIQIPQGFEIDESLSTFQKIIFKPVIPLITSKQSSFKYGDIVNVVDGSCNIDKRTSVKRSGIDRLFTQQAKVIMLNLCIFIDKDNHALKSNLWAYADLLLKFPSGEEIYCSSEMCRLAIKKISAEERMTEIWKSCNNVKYSSDNCRTYFKDKEPMFQQDWNNQKLYYRYSLVYVIFEKEYNMKTSEINDLVIKVLSKDLNTFQLKGEGGWEVFCCLN